MKKLSNKIISLICCIAMLLITCFGISFKIAHKTYADDLTPITDKQRLGAFLSSLAFSCGVRVYIATVGTYEWLVDNFNSVMLRLQFAMSANDVYQNAVDNYDNENKTYKLDPEFTKAVQEYLKYLQGEGINEYSGTVEIGSYEEVTQGSYIDMQPNTEYYFGTNIQYGGHSMYIMVDKPARIVGLINNNNYCGMNLISLDRTCKARTRQDNTNWGSWGGYRSSSTYNGTKFYTLESNTYPKSGYNGLPLNHTSASNTNINNNTYYEYYNFSYGASAVIGSTQEIPVNGKPNPYWSDTEITLDRDAEYKVDYSDTDGAEETSTLDELIQLINELIDTGTEEQQQTIPKVDVQIFTPTIDPTIVDIPTLFDGIPEIITPECVGLGSCLISGVQTASQHLQNVYNSNSSVANYTMVSLAIGIALYILTGGI